MTSFESASCEARDKEELEAAFGAVLSGDYTSDEFKRANRHLASCAACRAEYGELAAFHRGLLEFYAAPDRSEDAVRQERQERPARRVVARRAAWGSMALAASLLVGIAVWQSAPDPSAFTAPAPAFVAAPGGTTEPGGATDPGGVLTPSGAASPSGSAGAAAGAAESPVDVDAMTWETDVDEISDAELDEILGELGY